MMVSLIRSKWPHEILKDLRFLLLYQCSHRRTYMYLEHIPRSVKDIAAVGLKWIILIKRTFCSLLLLSFLSDRSRFPLSFQFSDHAIEKSVFYLCVPEILFSLNAGTLQTFFCFLMFQSITFWISLMYFGLVLFIEKKLIGSKQTDLIFLCIVFPLHCFSWLFSIFWVFKKIKIKWTWIKQRKCTLGKMGKKHISENILFLNMFWNYCYTIFKILYRIVRIFFIINI